MSVCATGNKHRYSYVLGRIEEYERYRRFVLLLGLATCREVSEHKSADSEGVHIRVFILVINQLDAKNFVLQ